MGPMDRREFIVKSLIFSSALSVPLLASSREKELRIGVITDCHYADKDMRGTREYRDTLKKMSQAVDQFNKDNLDFVIELGDFIDSAGGNLETEISYLKTIEKEYAKNKAPRYYVYGNHCLDTLTRKEFSAHTKANKKGYYSFDKGLYHIVVLDACYTSKGEPYSRKNFHWTDTSIPKEEISWLKADLATTSRPTIVFVHQRLDDAGNHSVKNAPQIRRILEDSKRVIGVFQGHAHINTHVEINKIHYTTIRGMVDGKGIANNGYTEIILDKKGTITVKGFVKQDSYKWSKSTR